MLIHGSDKNWIDYATKEKASAWPALLKGRNPPLADLPDTNNYSGCGVIRK
jgi:hypothetical protein